MPKKGKKRVWDTFGPSGQLIEVAKRPKTRAAAKKSCEGVVVILRK